MIKKLLFFLITISILALPQLISPPTTAGIDWSGILPGKDPGKDESIDFCKRRQGNQINLETWYSGKCDPSKSTFSGDQVGFSDIIILDIFEKINGADDGTTGPIKKFFDILQITSAPKKIIMAYLVNQHLYLALLSNPLQPAHQNISLISNKTYTTKKSSKKPLPPTKDMVLAVYPPLFQSGKPSEISLILFLLFCLLLSDLPLCLGLKTLKRL